jgi:uncharacterized heparinase superfamily protein
LEAEHNGYRYLNSIHRRIWKVDRSKFLISDYIKSSNKYISTLNLHLHPEIEIASILNNSLKLNNDIQISFNSESNIQIKDYEYSDGFNKLRSAKKISVNFYKEVTTEISYENSFHNR